jgi:hypothetical protein
MWVVEEIKNYFNFSGCEKNIFSFFQIEVDKSKKEWRLMVS